MTHWLIEPSWATATIQRIKSIGIQSMRWTGPRAMEDDGPSWEPEPWMIEAGGPGYRNDGGMAVFMIDGPLQKFDSSMGGTNTVRLRQAVRNATNDPNISGILLRSDSPGGTVAGTKDLADAVAAARAAKPVYAQVEDMTASAAYWIVSQATKVYANETALIGSIGTMIEVADTSKAYEAAGIIVHVIGTGPMKGAMADGTPITPDHLAYLQGIVDGLNAFFLKGVSEGRGLPAAQVKTAATGEVYLAKQAKALGLIDGIQSLDVTMAQLQAKMAPRKRERMATLIDLEEASG
jgi:signal peptide peptidase SppA